MFKKGKMNSVGSEADNPSCIETELKDILTLNSCTALVSELIKFILYRKQQLPYTFDRLKYLITKRNSIEKTKQDNPSIACSSIERQFRVAQEGLETLELLFEKTREELADSGDGRGFISEVALLFGSTPMTPKQVYRIHLPQLCLDHSSVNHPERKHLFHLLQTVILSNNLCNMLTKPMNPTNMYLFIRKNRQNEREVNKWFIPKNRYDIPSTGQHFHIKFRHPNSHEPAACGCQDFQIYSDDASSPEYLADNEKNFGSYEGVDSDDRETPSETEWYQACAIFKGFTDVYINGVSVADLWLR